MNAERWSTYSFSTILDGTGYGYVRLAPSGTNWRITSMNVRVETAVLEATVRTYARQIGQAYVIDTSVTGSTGDTSDTEYRLQDGEPLYVEWTGGDANKNAYVTISVWESVTGGGFRAI